MDRHGKIRGEGVLRGADGRVQGRKLAAWISFVIGIGLLVQGTFVRGICAVSPFRRAFRRGDADQRPPMSA